MPRYVVLYRFTNTGASGIRESVKRAGRQRQANARLGFKIQEIFWLQGPYDMCAIVDAPSEELMMGAMLNIIGAGNVTSTTMRAFDATEMSRIMAQTPSLSAPAPAANGRAKKAPAKSRR